MHVQRSNDKTFKSQCIHKKKENIYIYIAIIKVPLHRSKRRSPESMLSDQTLLIELPSSKGNKPPERE